jgi:3-oxoadipate enol-lactonase
VTATSIPVPGGSLYTEVEGSGPALLLMHAGVANLRMWDPHVPELARRHTVARFDARGFGRTETEDVEFSNCADAIAVLDHLDVEKAILVGASRSGAIALDTTIEFPERVAGLVSVAGGVGGYWPDVPDDEEQWEEAEKRWKAKDWEWLADFEAHVWVDGPGQPEDRTDPEVRSTVHGWILDNYRAEKAEGKPIRIDPPAAERLGEVVCPVLVIVGDKEEPGTLGSCHHLAESVPGARIEVIENAAHMLNLEYPDRFTELLLGFAESVYG